MKNYWKDHFNRSAKFHGQHLFKQVGKTVNGIEVDANQINYIVKTVMETLQLKTSDIVLDVCCGNGLITKLISKKVKHIYGIDFSEGLLEVAKKKNQAKNIVYIESDILDLQEEILLKASKCYMYEALQHFTSDMFSHFLDRINSTSIQSIFIGSIPDKNKIWHYYDTDEKREFYFQKEKEHKPHMGKWWLKDEIRKLIDIKGYNVTFLRQNKSLYTCYYRFDCILEKISG